MLGFLKNLFGKGDGKQPAPEPPSKPTPASAPKPAAPAPAASAPAAPAKPAPQPSGPVDTTAIHLEPILAKLPAELKGAVKKSPGGKVKVPIPTQTILEQMPSGVVKVPFGELRAVAPSGTFADDASHDDTPVSIPLPEILASINPALLKRRPSQKKIEVPDDVTGLFHRGGISTPPPSSAEPKPAAPEPPAPAAGKPSAPPPPPTAPQPPPPAPKPAEPAAPIAVSSALREMMTAASSAAKPPAPTPVPRPPAPPPPPAPRPPSPPVSAPAPKPPSPPPTPVAAPVPVAAEVGELSVPLADVSKDWPEPVRAELASVKPDSTLSLPLADVGNAIRAGKITFSWKQLRTWINPTSITAASDQDTTSLILPLSVVVPLFMAKSQPAKAQRKAAFDESIPDMFAPGKGAPAPAAASAAPAPAGTPAAAAPVPPPPAPLAPPLTPNQSVQQACALPGVAGALLVSQDGLLVASQLPPTVKGETVAAFLPQIFGRLSQNTKEMNLGELNGLTFTVDNVSWQLCKTGNLYFAVLGRKGESLPSAHLNPIAAEIGRQTNQ